MNRGALHTDRSKLYVLCVGVSVRVPPPRCPATRPSPQPGASVTGYCKRTVVFVFMGRGVKYTGTWEKMHSDIDIENAASDRPQKSHFFVFVLKDGLMKQLF